MTPHPVTETRDGVVYLLVPLPEVRRDEHRQVACGRWTWPEESWSDADLSETARRGNAFAAAAAAVLHDRQSERTPSPEEATVSETYRKGHPVFAGGDGMQPLAPTPEEATVSAATHPLRRVLSDDADPVALWACSTCAWPGSTTVYLGAAGAEHDAWLAPTPAPRTVTVDADDLRAVLEGDLGGYGWRSSNLRTRLRAALDRSDTGGQG